MTYDEKQTRACDALRERLQSIAILAVQAQEMDPSGDPLADLLEDIVQDLAVARLLNQDLGRDDVDSAANLAMKGGR